MFAMGPAFFKAASASYATLALTGSFAPATVGTAYSSSISISGGLEPYSLTGGTGVASGSLDSGFSLSITGTTGARFLTLTCASPATADTMSFTASVGSTDSQTATSAQSVVVSALDPYWSEVVSLLHCDGTDGSLVFTDAKGLVWASGLNTTIDNSVTLIAGGAIKLQGRVGLNNSYLRTPKSGIVFGSQDFCIDITVNLLAMPGSGLIGALFSDGDETGPDYYGLRWFINPDGSIVAYVSSGGTSVTLTLTSAAGVVAAGTRSRLRLSRSGTSFKMFAEGAVVASGTMTGAVYRPSKSTDVYIGMALDRGSTPAAQGWLASRVDEWRVTIGAAREHAAYTPSNVPFPNA